LYFINYTLNLLIILSI